MSPSPRATRYVAWLHRHARAVFVVAAATVALSAYLIATRLPVRADLSYLLPEDAPAVRDLRRLEDRLVAQDAILIAVESDDPVARAAVAADLAEAVRALPADLVAEVQVDDAETRRFLRDHAHLLVPLPDLEEARAALTRAVDAAKLAANPMFVDLDDEDDDAAAAADRARLDDLVARRRDALAQLDRSGMISADGRLQLVVVMAGFAKTDVTRGERLMGALADARRQVLARPGRDHVAVGFCSGAATTVAEHHALVRGMLLSSLITGLLVGLALWLYLRRLGLLVVLATTLTAGTVTTFGVAALTVGHLNAASAFLGAIIAGNGVNCGILILARYRAERRRRPAGEAMAHALADRLRPTLVASLGAAIAYGSLAATSFRGFSDFAVIGAAGMALCWLASFTLLPALVVRVTPGAIPPASGRSLGRVLARMAGGRRPAVVCALAGLLAVGAGWVSWQFIARDPFEYDARKLQSDGGEARTVMHWRAVTDRAFGRGFGGAGQVYLAVDRPEQVEQAVAALRALGDDAPPDQRVIGRIRSIADVMPPDQDARLAVLRDIDALLERTPLDDLEPDMAATVAELRPPADLRPITTDQLPPSIVDRLRERDGRVGLIIGVRPSDTIDDWNGRDIIRYAGVVRRLHLADGSEVATSGASVIFADILQTIRRDAPVVLAWAGGLLLVLIGVLVGVGRRALAVVAATALGALAMVAGCALLGLRVTFLDFVALPITLGLGVDYAINVVHGRTADAADGLRDSGSAVVLCSLTTIIGYGSLLIAANQAIRGFGAASLLGEVCCLVTALTVAPAVVGLRLRARDRAELAAAATGRLAPVTSR